MTNPSGVTPQDVYTFPWETGEAQPTAEEAVASLRSKLDEDSDESEAPKNSDGPAKVEEEKDSAPEAESDEEEEDTPETESDSDEAGEEADEDEDEDDADEEPEDFDDWDRVIDLGEEKVTLRELRDRGLRQSDYTRKTQVLADERREVDAARDEYRKNLEVLHGVLEKAKGPEVDWAKLAREDPQEYAAKRAEHDEIQRQQQQVEAEHQRVVGEQKAKYLREKQARIDAETRKLVEALPSWKEPKVAEKEQAAMIDYAMKMGFTAEDLDTVEDHRVFVMLHKAMQYDKAQRAQSQVAEEVKEKLVKPKPGKNLKPGTKKGQGTRSKVAEQTFQKAREKLAETGDLRVAGSVFAEYLRELER